MSGAHITASRFDEEVLRFCKHIDARFPEAKKYIFLSMFFSDLEELSFHDQKEYAEIVTSYGYGIEEVPDFLEDKGIIISKHRDRWYIGKQNMNDAISYYCEKYGYDSTKVTAEEVKFDAIDSERKMDWRELDYLEYLLEQKRNPYEITRKAREVNAIGDGYIIEFFGNWTSRDINDTVYSKINRFGPEDKSKLLTVLIDREKLRDYISIATGTHPVYSISTSEFIFLGEKVKFKGTINGHIIKILTDKINSIVSYEELYNVDDRDYDKDVRILGIGEVHKTIRNDIADMMKKLRSSTKISNVLFSTEQKRMGGHGLFIDSQRYKTSIK